MNDTLNTPDLDIRLIICIVYAMHNKNFNGRKPENKSIFEELNTFQF